MPLLPEAMTHARSVSHDMGIQKIPMLKLEDKKRTYRYRSRLGLSLLLHSSIIDFVSLITLTLSSHQHHTFFMVPAELCVMCEENVIFCFGLCEQQAVKGVFMIVLFSIRRIKCRGGNDMPVIHC